MKNYVLPRSLWLIVTVLCAMPASGQTIPGFVFQKSYEFNSGSLPLPCSDVGNSLMRDVNGDLFVVGTNRNYGGGFDGTQTMEFLKTDAFGRIIWSKTHLPVTPARQYSEAHSTTLDPSNAGYAVTGYQIDYLNALDTSNADIFLHRMQGNGTLVAKNYYGTGDFDIGNEVQATKVAPGTQTYDGLYAVVGGVNGNINYGLPGGVGQPPPIEYYNGDLVIFKTAGTGTTQGGNGGLAWSTVVQHKVTPMGSCPDQQPKREHHLTWGYSLKQVDANGDGNIDDHYIAAGIHHDPFTYCQSGPLPAVTEHAYLVKIHDVPTPGTVQWTKVITDAGSMQDGAYSIQVVERGIGQTPEFIFVGYSLRNHNGRVDRDIYVVRTNVNGIPLPNGTWIYDSGGDDVGYSIVRTKNSAGAYNGYAIAATYMHPTFTAGLPRMLLFTISTTGNVNWARSYGGAYASTGNEIIQVSANELAAVGSLQSTSLEAYLVKAYTGTDCDDCPGSEVSLAKQTVTSTFQDVAVTTQSITYYDIYHNESPHEKLTHEQCEGYSVDAAFQWRYHRFQDRGRDARQLSGGNYVMTGWADDAEFGPTMIDFDLYLIRTDPTGAVGGSGTFSKVYREVSSGEEVYSQQYGYGIEETDEADGLTGDRLENVVIAGAVRYGVDDTRDSNALLLKVDRDGGVLWSKSYGKRTDDNLSHDMLHDIGLAGTGYVSVGFSNSVFNGTSQPAGNNVYALRVGSNGNISSSTSEWGNIYGSDGEDYGISVMQTYDGGYIIAGYSNGFNAGHANLAGYDVLVIKLQSDGTVSWAKVFGTANDDYGFSIYQTDDNADQIRDDGFIVVGNTLHGGNGSNLFALKLFNNGTLDWSRILDNGGYEDGTSVRQLSGGGLLVAGTVEDGAEKKQGLLTELDGSGNIVWERDFPEVPNGSAAEPNEDHFEVGIETMEGGYAALGSTCSFSDLLKGDIYFVKLNCVNESCNGKEPSLEEITHTTYVQDVTSLIETVEATDMESITIAAINVGIAENLCSQPEEPVSESEILSVPGVGQGIAGEMPVPNTDEFAASSEIVRGNVPFRINNVGRDLDISVNIHDLSGRLVLTPSIQDMERSANSIEVNLSKLAQGYYLVSVKAGLGSVRTFRVLLIH